MGKDSIARGILALVVIITSAILYIILPGIHNDNTKLVVGIFFLILIGALYGVIRAIVFNPDGIFKELD